MNKNVLGYQADFSGKANTIELPDFNDSNIVEMFSFDNGSFLVKRNDGTIVCVYIDNGIRMVYSNKQIGLDINNDVAKVVL